MRINCSQSSTKLTTLLGVIVTVLRRDRDGFCSRQFNSRAIRFNSPTHERGFTLAEVVVALGIVTLVFGGIITSYVQTTRHTQWSAYALAAQALSTRELEQARAARWDIRTNPVDETITIPPTSVAVLDLPVSGTNVVRATNYFSVGTLTISTTPLVKIKAIRVDTVWPFGGRSFTNTTVTYRAPDQ